MNEFVENNKNIILNYFRDRYNIEDISIESIEGEYNGVIWINLLVGGTLTRDIIFTYNLGEYVMKSRNSIIEKLL